MKLTKTELNQIIKEELGKVLNELLYGLKPGEKVTRERLGLWVGSAGFDIQKIKTVIEWVAKLEQMDDLLDYLKETNVGKQYFERYEPHLPSAALKSPTDAGRIQGQDPTGLETSKLGV